MLKLCVSFFKNNGLFGYGLKFLPKVLSLRGGENTEILREVAESLAAQRLNEEIQAILDDTGITREQKQKLVREITKGVLQKSFKSSKFWKTSSYRKSLQFGAEYPVYSQIKKKFLFILMSGPMFCELKRGKLVRQGDWSKNHTNTINDLSWFINAGFCCFFDSRNGRIL